MRVNVPVMPPEGFYRVPLITRVDSLTSVSCGITFRTMSTVSEVKAATRNLSPEERWELYRWLGESKDVQQFRYEELRREIAIGIQQADRGELAPLNMGAVKADIHQRLKKAS